MNGEIFAVPPKLEESGQHYFGAELFILYFRVYLHI